MTWFCVLLFLTAPLETNIRDWLTLKDYQTAALEAGEAVNAYPDSVALRKLKITTLAKTCRIKEMLKEWHTLEDFCEIEAYDRDLIEEMAWGVIHYGNQSSSPMIRLISMLAAAFARDVVGVQLVKQQMQSPNSLLRAVACELCTKLGDDTFKEPITHLIHHERVPQVRLLAILAAGALRITPLKEEFATIIDSPSSSDEEKEACIQALVNMQGDLTPYEITLLLQGKKEHQKMVGCKLALMADFPIEMELFTPLLDDPSSAVRLTAFRAMGLLYHQNQEQKPHLLDLATEGMNDPNPQVQVTALWVHTLLDPRSTESHWAFFLNHPEEETRLWASALLSSAGSRALPLLVKAYTHSKDSFVKWNLALGMIQQRHHVDQAAETLVDALKSSHPRWMWKERMGVRYLAPTTISFSMRESSSIDTHNLCQLEILSVISLFDQKRAQEGFYYFLKQPSWKISGPAAAMLLTDGPQEGIEIVQEMLQDPDFPFPTDAAILLAMWGGDPTSATTLQEHYQQADRKSKESILEALGRVGDKKTLPFLVECLQEPFPVMRTIAASSILQVINH